MVSRLCLDGGGAVFFGGRLPRRGLPRRRLAGELEVARLGRLELLGRTLRRLLVALGLLCWSYARSANLDYTLARSDGTGELGTLRQCVEHLEDGGGAGSVTDVKSTAAELAAIVERLAVLAERLQTAEEGS